MAGIRYEKDGYLIGNPKSHKREGWVTSFVAPKGKYWGVPMRGGK